MLFIGVRMGIEQEIKLMREQQSSDFETVFQAIGVLRDQLTILRDRMDQRLAQLGTILSSHDDRLRQLENTLTVHLQDWHKQGRNS